MASSSHSQEPLRLGVFPSAGRGALAGIVGGIVFFLVWFLVAGPQISQVLNLISKGVMHIENPILGFIDHLVISTIIGATYGVVLSNLTRVHRYATAPIYGLLNGVIWWVLGGLVILPILVGIGPQFAAALTPTFIVDLVAHLLYGIVTALVFTMLLRRATQTQGGLSL